MHDIDFTQLEYEQDGSEFEAGGVFSETDEFEMAGQLLEIQDEAELDQFLGDLIKKAGRAVGRFVSSPTGQALGGILKNAAKQALPVVGSAIGGYVGGAKGAKLGGQLAGKAGTALGLEFEGEEEMEIARKFIRMAGDAVKHIASAPPGVEPRTAVRKAVTQAAKTFLPTLLGETGSTAGPAARQGARGQSGRWIRRGSKIVLIGV
jgi:hypothetical protein